MCNVNSRFCEQTAQQVRPFAVILFQAFFCSLAGVYNLWLLCVSQKFLPTRRCKRSFNFDKYFNLLWPILAFLLFSSFKGWYIFNIFQMEPSTEECEQWQTPLLPLPPQKMLYSPIEFPRVLTGRCELLSTQVYRSWWQGYDYPTHQLPRDTEISSF